MKKALLATTLLVATAGFAAADVTLSGYGRFGLVHSDDGVASDTVIHTRLRFNIDASLETDSGLKFGGRIRMQHTEGGEIYDDGAGGARLSAAMLYVETGGFRVEVGNSGGAFDNAGLLYNSEIGFTDSSFGESKGFNYFGFTSGPFGGADADYMGVYASYTAGSITARISAIDPDQSADATPTTETEVSVSVDYSSGPFSVSVAAAQDGAGIADNDLFFIGAAYKIGDATTVGLNYHDEELLAPGVGGKTVTLYANHTMANGVTVAGYLSDWSESDDMAIGLGASYSLGEGAKISGAFHKAGDSSYADLGVRFDF